MPKATLTKEVIVTCPNKVGTFAKVSMAMAEAKINIDACCCYTQDGTNCNFHLVTSDLSKTVDVCNKSGWTPKENPVVCCELANKPGTLAEAANKLAQAGINIEYCYATTGTGPNTKVFFATTNNTKATQVLG